MDGWKAAVARSGHGGRVAELQLSGNVVVISVTCVLSASEMTYTVSGGALNSTQTKSKHMQHC